MNNLQAMIDGMSVQLQRERSKIQMTLGDLIIRLQEMPGDLIIKGIGGDIDICRGYYPDLAFAHDKNGISVSNLLDECQMAIGKVFYGYKGGRCVMGELTPLWVADYGCLGEKIMAINDDGTIETVEEE